MHRGNLDRVCIFYEGIERKLETITNAIKLAFDHTVDILLTLKGSLSKYTLVFDRAMVDRALAQVVSKSTTGHISLTLSTCFKED